MATSRSLILSVFLSGLVFSAAALPLAILGSRPITVEIDEKPLLTGRIQDLASPYLGLAFGLSAGVGLLALSLSEWRHTSRKLNQARDRVSALEHQLQQQANQVERLKFSESRLQSQGLNFFLDPADAALPAAAPMHSAPMHSAQYVVSHNAPLPQSNQQNQPSPQLEEVVVTLKQLMNQVEQLKTSEPSDSIGHSINASVNASARA